MNVNISVVIVNYKVPDYIHQCILSLKKALKDYKYEIFVVDNNSMDESVEFIKKWHPDIYLIENDDNLGFSKANNIAIKKSKGEFILVINPDTLVNENMIVECVEFMNAHMDAGAIGVKMFSAQGKYAPESKRGVPTPFTAFCKLMGLCRLFPKNKILGRYYLGHLDNNKESEIEILSGACMFIRHQVLDKVGLFDEDYFMYGEDIDLSYRILKAGYKNYFIPTPIIHYKGESTQKISYQYVNNFNKSMIVFFKKHFSFYSWMLEIPILIAVYIKAAIGYVKVGICKALGLRPSVQDVAGLKKFLVISSVGEDIDPAVNILKKYGYHTDVKMVDENIMKNGHLALPQKGCGYDFIVYNTEVFSYRQIIGFFTKNDKGDDVEMALYHPDTNKIITPIQVLNY